MISFQIPTLATSRYTLHPVPEDQLWPSSGGGWNYKYKIVSVTTDSPNIDHSFCYWLQLEKSVSGLLI